MRSGHELSRATRPFAVEDRRKSWLLLVQTLAVAAFIAAAVVWSPHPALQATASVLLGLTLVRIFIFWHDYLHTAIFRGSKVAPWILGVFGWWLLAVDSVWKETHDYHHANNAKLIGSSIGSYPVVTLATWRRMSPAMRLSYRATRHPLTMLFGYLFVFVFGMALAPFRRNARRHWKVPLALLTHYAVVALAVWGLGWWTGLLLTLVPTMVASAAGAYLFYAQHNFPAMQLRDRRSWDYYEAALRSSSMFDMPRWMHWFTGNIGYHHVHHLNHRIPFYRLPEAMAGVEELQRPGRTSWKPKDVWDCLQLAVWDTENGRMLTWRELRTPPDRVPSTNAEPMPAEG